MASPIAPSLWPKSQPGNTAARTLASGTCDLSVSGKQVTVEEMAYTLLVATCLPQPLIKLRSEMEPAPRSRRSGRHRFSWVVILLLLLPCGVLLAERWLGRRALQGCKREMEARGEVFDANHLWLPASAQSTAFSTQIVQIIRQVPEGFGKYAGQLSGIVMAGPGMARRGSQETEPPIIRKDAVAVNGWHDLDGHLDEGQYALRSLRAMMKNPPAAIHYDRSRVLQDASIPNFVGFRVAAQTLHTATIVDLHRGDLAHALEDLRALSAFSRLHEEDPTLISFMIRIAILGLSIDAYWDALQASGWTEAQLAALQEANQWDRMLSRKPRIMEAERVVRLNQLEWFRSHSYGEWINKYGKIYTSFGLRLDACDTNRVIGFWRQWLFHPTWRFAWADREQVIYIRASQQDVEVLRQAAAHGSWQELRNGMAANHQNFHLPGLSWRFYISLPVLDRFSTIIGPSPISPPPYPYPQFQRAWFTSMKNLTLGQMVSAAIALKRYELRHGTSPATLADLVPEFLARIPLDYIDGQPLRYRLNARGGFTLYSVGEDGVDNGGDAASFGSGHPEESADSWTGLDWVWPRTVAPAKAGELSQILHR